MASSESSSSDSPPLRSPRNFETILVQSRKGFDEFSHGQKAVVFALTANLLIGAVKLAAGLVSRHSAMLSEAIHSFADAINSAFLLIGLRKGRRAADKTHPFGYGLETTLWAMLASVLMLLLASWSMYLGINRFWAPEPFGSYTVAAAVLLVSILLEISAVSVASNAVLSEKDLQARGFFERFWLASRHVHHVVSPTTRFVFYEDTIALFGAVIALIAISISHFGVTWNLLPVAYQYMPDALASVLIGLLLLVLAVYLFLHNSKGLTGTAANPQLEEKIREYVLNLHGVSQVYDLKTIDYGMSGVVVHMRVEVDPDTQVKDVDDLTERIRDRVQARMQNVKEVIIEVLADESSEEWSDQFYRLIEQGRTLSVLKPREERILRNVYEFTHVVVGDIMVPRTDVDCIEVSQSLNDLVDMIVETGHTRIPVYREDTDNMLGAIHAKDVFEYIRQGRNETPLANLVREFDVYPENKAVSDLLEEFKRKKIQIAMVADEHGGFAGIVTIEDLLEEIVGEIWDEYDDNPALLEQVAPNCLRVSGRCLIDDVNDRYGLSIPDEEFNTLGGFVFGLLGREPKQGDQTVFEDITFTVLEMDGHRVDQVQMEAPTPFVLAADADDLDYTPNGQSAHSNNGG